MPPLSRPRVPWWFVALLAGVFAALARSVAPASVPLTGAGGDDPAVQLAFWPVFVMIAQALWTGVQVAAKVALAILQYSVQILWRVATLLGKFVGELGRFAWRGLKVAWSLLKATYDQVLKPAWRFVWKWVEKTEAFLRRTFEPLLRWLGRLRGWVLEFYANYVRPILDVIDISRRALRVLSALGVDWARKLDAELARIQSLIDAPFRLVIGKLNEIINLVNRVVTLDGLFQRLALIRSIERDIRFVSNQIANAFYRPATAAEKLAMNPTREPLTFRQHVSEARRVARHQENPYSSRIDEEVSDVRRLLRQLRR